MNLKRTTILPIDDHDLSLSIFESYVQKEMMIIMILLGDDPKIRGAVERADNLAKISYFQVERWVLWIRDHHTLKTELTDYLRKTDCQETYSDIRCFSLSPVKDQVAGIITKDNNLSYVDLQQSFFTAHQHDLNV